MAMTQTSGSRCCKLRLVAYGLQMPGATTCSRQRVGRRCCEPMCHARPMDVGTDKSQALASKATLIQQPGPGAPRCSTDKRAQSPELWRTAGGVLGGLKGRSTAQTGQGSQSGRGRGDGVWDIKACVQQSPEKLPCSSKKKFLFGPWQAGKALLPDGTREGSRNQESEQSSAKIVPQLRPAQCGSGHDTCPPPPPLAQTRARFWFQDQKCRNTGSPCLDKPVLARGT